MHRIDTIGNVGNAFVDYDAISNPQGTVIGADFMNDLQEEICNFIESRGITLVKGQQDQLELAIQDILDDELDAKDFIALADGSKTTPSLRFGSDTNTGIFRSASDQIDIVTGGESRFRIESTGQIKAVYQSTVGTPYNTQLDNGYLCRAWVNFNGASDNDLSGTYSQSGTTVTFSGMTDHRLIAGNSVNVDFTSGGATVSDGIYTVVTVISSSSFTITVANSTTTSGNATLQRNTIRASGNVSSITDNGTGDYTVNFVNAMPDANYCCVFGAQNPLNTISVFNTFVGIHPGFTPSASSVRIRTTDTINSASNLPEIANSDTLIVNVAVFR